MRNLPDNPLESFKQRNPHLYPSQEPVAVTGRRVRQSQKPLLNKLEMEYLRVLAHHTDCRIHAQAMRFMLANGHWYKPDFVVVSPKQLMAFEVKGPRSWRGGFENLKVAADRYRWITWTLVWKENGHWKEQIILPA